MVDNIMFGKAVGNKHPHILLLGKQNVTAPMGGNLALPRKTTYEHKLSFLEIYP